MKLNNGIPEIARYAQTTACLAVLLITVLASCQNPMGDGGQKAASSGTVTITLARADSAARSIMPSAPSFSRYALTLQKGETSQTTDASGLAAEGVTVQLELGTWSITVDAFQELDHDGNAETATQEYKAATATTSFTVTAEGSNSIAVQLEPIAAEDAPHGVFAWDITLPEGVDSASMSLGAVSGLTGLDLTQAADRSGFAEAPSGIYNLTILLSKDGLSAGRTEKVYIYSGLQTTATLDLSDLVFGADVLIAGTLTVTNNGDPDSGYVVNAYANADSADSESSPIGTASIPSITEGVGAFLLSIPVSAYNALEAGTASGKKVYLRATHSSIEIRENSVVTVDNLLASGAIGKNVSITIVPTYTVSYDANDGIGTAPASQTVNEGSIVMVSGQGELTRSGHNFTGWNTSAYGSGTAYNAGSSLEVNEDITLYAQWAQYADVDITVLPTAIPGDALIDLTGPAAPVVWLNGTITASVNNIEAYGTSTGFSWYIDGVQIAGQTASILAAQNARNYSLGAHSLTVIATKSSDGKSYSKTVNFTIVEE